jgi:hypothetical protein
MISWLLSAIVLGTGGLFATLLWREGKRGKAAGVVAVSVAVSAVLIGT